MWEKIRFDEEEATAAAAPAAASANTTTAMDCMFWVSILTTFDAAGIFV